MSKIKYLLKNIGLLAISQFGTKILAFFLVPLYTNVLSTSEYGTYDLFSSSINLLIPIVTLNMADAVLRFSIDEEEKGSVFSIGLKYALFGTLISFLFVVVNHYTRLVTMIDEYWLFFPLMFFVTVLNTTFIYFCRGIDKVKDTAISGIICTAVMIGLNVYFLLVVKLGLNGYFWSNIIALFVQIIYLFVSCKLWKYITTNKNRNIEKGMKKYASPLIANNIAWWINNSSDRYIVTFLCGVAENGVYSVGYKIPTILNVFQSIFNQAWTLSAVKDFDSDDKSDFFSKMYAAYNCGMVLVCSGLILMTKLLAKLFYAKDFFAAWQFVPFLLISIVFGSLAGYLGGIFSAVKDSKMFAQSTLVGAVVNTVLNIVLVQIIGSVGAAISTMIAFWLVWAMRLKHVKRYVTISINLKRDYITYALLLLQSLLFFIVSKDSSTVLYLSQLVTSIVIIASYRVEIKNILKMLLIGIKRLNP